MRRVVLRLVTLVFVLWGIATVVFFVSRVLPGNPTALLAGPIADPATLAATRSRLGLDRSIPEQYGIFLHDVARGDLGLSYTTGRTVASDLGARIPATLELIVVAFLLAAVLSVVFAVAAAALRGKALDRAVRGWTLLGVAVPTFWLGLLLITIFYRSLRWASPPIGRLGIDTSPPPHVTGFYLVDSLVAGDFGAFRDALGHLVLPAVTLAVVLSATLTRILRAKMVEVLRSDYILGARAFGVPLRTRLFKDALKNAVIPVLPVAASAFGYLVGGAVFVEKIFSWPGVGLYAVNAIANSDYPAIQGFVLFATFVYVVAFLAVDLLTYRLDVRLRMR